MQKTLLHCLLALLALTLATCNHAAAQNDSSPRSLQINSSNAHRTYACHNPGDSVQVTGGNNILTITGNCGSLQVTGNSNSITIDSVQNVQFTGESNSVLYRSSHRPSVSDLGRSNSLAHAAGQDISSQSQAGRSDGGTITSSDQVGSTTVANGSVASAVSAAQQAKDAASRAAASTAGLVQGVQIQGNSLNITLSNQRTTQDCGDGKNANINGYQNEITLKGSCSQVNVNGWQNTIHIEETAGIQVVGHTNTVTWERGRGVHEPTVQIGGGIDNSVTHLVPAAQ